MKGDFTRHTFDPTRQFTTVRMQQGRVQLDADWNEQADLRLYRDETEAADLIGRCDGPLAACHPQLRLRRPLPRDKSAMDAGRKCDLQFQCRDRDD